jgi:hypothetical protein
VWATWRADDVYMFSAAQAALVLEDRPWATPETTSSDVNQ